MARLVTDTDRAIIRLLQENLPQANASEPVVSPYASWDETELKDFIKLETGSAPRGNPSRATLVKMVETIQAEKGSA